MGAEASPIRVGVDATTGVLGDVVRRAIREAPGLELVALPVGADRSGAQSADVVILAGTDPDTITWPTRAFGHAPTRLLAISENGHTGCLFELLPRREALGELTPEALIAAVRAPLPQVAASHPGYSTPLDSDLQQGRHRASPPAPRRPNADQED